MDEPLEARHYQPADAAGAQQQLTEAGVVGQDLPLGEPGLGAQRVERLEGVDSDVVVVGRLTLEQSENDVVERRGVRRRKDHGRPAQARVGREPLQEGQGVRQVLDQFPGDDDVGLVIQHDVAEGEDVAGDDHTRIRGTQAAGRE